MGTEYNIEILSAPSILGLRPNGVEELGKSLLHYGLAAKLPSRHPVVHIPTLNALYSDKRDQESNCLNARSIKDFSLTLYAAISHTINGSRFPLVLGGDCSILLGIMPALKAKGTYGLIFLDAHADFYQPGKSVTGEVADMDLAIVTGRGPILLTNIHNLHPYAEDKNVVHIGQRDWEETKKYGSQDIRQTAIKCFNLTDIEEKGLQSITAQVLQYIDQLEVAGFWIHFDTDVLSDEVNPAVDYRLPGGLRFGEAEYLIKALLSTGRMTGMSVTIFNPKLDKNGRISKRLNECIIRSFE